MSSSPSKDEGNYHVSQFLQNSEIDTEQDTEYLEEFKGRDKKHKSSSSADEDSDDEEENNKPWSFGDDSAGTGGGFGKCLSNNSFEGNQYRLLGEESDDCREPKHGGGI